METIIYTDADSGRIVKEIAKKLNCDCECIYPVSKKKRMKSTLNTIIFLWGSREELIIHQV